jgi:hypothetical protein
LIYYLTWRNCIYPHLRWPLLLFNLSIDFWAHLIWVIYCFKVIIITLVSVLRYCLLLHPIIIKHLTNVLLFKKISDTERSFVILLWILLIHTNSSISQFLTRLWRSTHFSLYLIYLPRKLIISRPCLCMFLFYLNFKVNKLFFKFGVYVARAKEGATSKGKS